MLIYNSHSALSISPTIIIYCFIDDTVLSAILRPPERVSLNRVSKRCKAFLGNHLYIGLIMPGPTCTHSTLFAEQCWASAAMPSVLGLARLQKALQLSSTFTQASLLPKRLVCRMTLRSRISWRHSPKSRRLHHLREHSPQHPAVRRP